MQITLDMLFTLNLIFLTWFSTNICSKFEIKRLTNAPQKNLVFLTITLTHTSSLG